MPDQSYDINLIFAEMEAELIASYRKNMSRHLQEELDAGFSWPMWQEKKLADLRQYQKESRRIVNKYARLAVDAATGIIIDTYVDGKEYADSIIRTFRSEIEDKASFGRTDRRKVDALIDAVRNDFQKASAAALRLVDDEYRKIVFKAQVGYSSGVLTLSKAVDWAAKDFLEAGINCITYRNGNKVNIASYAEMVMRTSAKRAYLTGEGARNNELGVHLVQITSYGACSDTCLPWQGKVYVDDVYSGGEPDGKHPLLSTAMANGLFHPNCRHTSQPFFEGISSLPPAPDPEKVRERYQAEQRQREIERNIRKYKRIEAGSTDEQNRAKARAKVQQWQDIMRKHLEENDFLRRNYSRERGMGIPYKPTASKPVPSSPVETPVPLSEAAAKAIRENHNAIISRLNKMGSAEGVDRILSDIQSGKYDESMLLLSVKWEGDKRKVLPFVFSRVGSSGVFAYVPNVENKGEYLKTIERIAQKFNGKIDGAMLNVYNGRGFPEYKPEDNTVNLPLLFNDSGKARPMTQFHDDATHELGHWVEANVLSKAEIAEFKRIAKKYHPDDNPGIKRRAGFRWLYPLNPTGRLFKSAGSKMARYYEEMFAEATSVKMTDKAEDIANAREVFPEIMAFMDKIYGNSALR